MDKIQLGPLPFIGVMPAVLVGTNVNGKPNYMTAAWATVASMSPPMICVAINHARHTMKGIDENGTFSLNVTSAKQVAEMDYCGLVSGVKADKSKIFGTFYGSLKTAPMAGECPVNIECKVFKSVDCGSHELYIGEIAEVYVSEDCTKGGKPDIKKIDPIVYAGGNYWQLGKKAGKAFSAGKAYKKKKPTSRGPPVDIRFDDAKAASLIRAAGFEVESITDSGPDHYLILARPL